MRRNRLICEFSYDLIGWLICFLGKKKSAKKKKKKNPKYETLLFHIHECSFYIGFYPF